MHGQARNAATSRSIEGLARTSSTRRTFLRAEVSHTLKQPLWEVLPYEDMEPGCGELVVKSFGCLAKEKMESGPAAQNSVNLGAHQVFYFGPYRARPHFDLFLRTGSNMFSCYYKD